MKRWKMMLVGAVVGSVAMSVCAEEKKFKFFGQIEYLTYSDAFDENEKLFNDEVNELADTTGTDAFLSAASDTNDGVGIRVGILVPSRVKDLSVGCSVGYIKGPKFDGNYLYEYDDGSFAYVDNTKYESMSNLWRVMAESKYHIPLGEQFQARLGIGLGLATLKVEDDYSYVMTGDWDASGSYKTSITTTKFTWEIGPAIAYVTEKMGVELALTYSQMPSAEDMNSFQKFDWNPFGIRLGVEF